MRKEILAGLVLSLFCASSSVASSPGGELLRQCKVAEKVIGNAGKYDNDYELADGSLCLGYLLAVRDMLVQRGDACVPDNVSVGQLLQLVIEYNKWHEKNPHTSRLGVSVIPMVLEYPCKETKK